MAHQSVRFQMPITNLPAESSLDMLIVCANIIDVVMSTGRAAFVVNSGALLDQPEPTAPRGGQPPMTGLSKNEWVCECVM